MARDTLTLHEYLRIPNPTVNLDNSWTGTNTKSGPSMTPSEIKEWKDFTYSTLQAIYGELLKLEMRSQDLPNFSLHLPFHLSKIQDEDSLEALLIRWNNAVVSCALSVAQRSDGVIRAEIAGHRAGEIFMARGGHAFIPGRKAQKGSRPDWAGIIPSEGYQDRTIDNRKSCINVLPGDSKLSTKWSSSGDPNSLEFKKPFSQIFNYCDSAEVRYGYLLTPEELVVVRVSRKPSHEVSNSRPSSQRAKRPGTSEWKKAQEKDPFSKELQKQNQGVLEYKSIPWDDGSQRQEASLSVNLALWWLHMMAATARSIEPSYRDLSEEYHVSDTASTGLLRTAQNVPGISEQSSVSKSKKRRRASENEDDTRPLRRIAKSLGDSM